MLKDQIHDLLEDYADNVELESAINDLLIQACTGKVKNIQLIWQTDDDCSEGITFLTDWAGWTPLIEAIHTIARNCFKDAANVEDKVVSMVKGVTNAD